MKEADWTVDERAELARERREGFVLSKAFFRQASLQTTISVVFAGVLGIAVFNAMASHGFGIDLVFLAIAGFSLGSIPLAWHWEKRQEARYETEPEMRAALGRDGRLVSLLICQGAAPTGEDRGMLWFEDGRLYFAGRRTSFGLVPDQAHRLATVDHPVSGVRNRVNLTLRREGPVGAVALSFTPLVSSLANPDAAVGTLRADLDRWQDGQVQGEGQWPPFALGPCVVSERRLLTRALGTTLFGPLLPAAVLLVAPAPLVAAVAYGLGMTVFALTPGNALRWRAWWARRRLRRLE